MVLRRDNMDPVDFAVEDQRTANMQAMRPVLTTLMAQIKTHATTNPNAPYMTFDVPSFLFGYPLYNHREAIDYIKETLEEQGFTVWVANLRSYHTTGEIAANPKVELCYLDADHHQVRITGIAAIEADRELLAAIWEKNPLLRSYLGTPDNPELIVYRIDPTHVRYMREWALEYHVVDPAQARIA